MAAAHPPLPTACRTAPHTARHTTRAPGVITS
ncbi:hypothetical protein ABH940_003618 [Streptacidiphilus sp. BW17]